MKERFLKCKYPLVLSIITLLIGCLFVFLCILEPWFFRWITFFLVFAPFIIFAIITWFSNYFYYKKYVQTITLVLSVIITWGLLGYYCVVLFFGCCYASENDYTNIKNYERIVNSEYLLKVFPKNVPINVSNIQFSYNHGFLQGMSWISLSYEDDKLNKDLVDDKFNDISSRVGSLEDFSNDNFFQSTVFLNTSFEEDEKKEFTIYLIDSFCDESGYCNHGGYLIVAYNDKAQEILYKYYHW